MATPRQLVETVADTLGSSVGTVLVHDRNLSAAPVPLRTVAGRGKAVAKVTYIDGINLLIAAAASASVKDSVKTVLAYRDLRNEIAHSTGVARFDKLPAHHTLMRALEALMLAAVENEIALGTLNLKVKLCEPGPKAKIEWEINGESFWAVYESKAERTRRSKRNVGDLRRTITFTENSLFALGFAIGLSR